MITTDPTSGASGAVNAWLDSVSVFDISFSLTGFFCLRGFVVTGVHMYILHELLAAGNNTAWCTSSGTPPWYGPSALHDM